MRTFSVICLALFVGSIAFAGVEVPKIAKRGDANGDDTVDISDPIFISNYLFSAGPEPACLSQADSNHDGDVDNSDVVFLLNWLGSSGSPPPPYPGPYNDECVDDPAPSPGCANSCE